MMFVNKYKIRLDDVAASGGTFNIPIELTFGTVDQAEVVEKDFIKKEVEKAINPITDYEKARFTPTDSLGHKMQNIRYELNFLNSIGTIPSQTYYSDLGFVNDDIIFRKSNFIKSFMRLNFYDSDISTNQRLISFLTVFCKITKNEIIPIGSPNAGYPIPVNSFPVRFTLNNPITNPEGFAEGFYLYHFKDEVTTALPKSLYMRAEFNNAKTGRRTSFITDPTPQTIDNVVSKLHTKYILKRDVTGFYYEIDTTYSANVSYASDFDGNGVADDIIIKLYEIQVL